MAEASTGVKYSISIDDSELRRAAAESAKVFSGISDEAVKSGRKMDSIFDEAAKSASGAVDDFASLTEQIKFQKDIIDGLEKELKVLEDAYKNAAPGKEWANAVAKFNAAKAELQGEKKALEEMEAQANKTANSQVSMRTRMREVREELIALESAGKRGTEEYRKLQEEAGRLQDAYADASAQMRIMAHDQRGMQGIISGLTGVSAAFSAASGVVGLFTKDQEKLQQAMLKVQSLMSITVGLQQIQQTLNKDSAFRLVIINGLKDWWVKSTEKATAAMVAEAAATKAAGTAAATSAGFFRTLGVALKSLSAGAITAILAALTAIVVIVTKLIKGEKQISGELKRQLEYIKGIREARVEAQKATLKEATAMEQSVSRLKTLKSGTEEYGRAVKDIADKLGVQYDWLVKNTDKVKDLTDAWVKAKVAQATGDAYLNKATEIRTNVFDAKTKIATTSVSAKEQAEILGNLGFLTTDFIDQYTKTYKRFRELRKAQDKMKNDPYWAKEYRRLVREQWAKIQSMNEEIERLGEEQAKKYIKAYITEINKAEVSIKPVTDAQDEAERQRAAADAAKRADDKQREQNEAAMKAIEEGNKNLSEMRTRLERKYAESDIASTEDATQRKMKAIKDQEDQELAALEEFREKVLEEQRKIAKAEATLSGEAYDEKAVTLPEGFEQMLEFVTDQVKSESQKQRDAVIAEAHRAYDELAAEYAGLEGKIAAVKAKYAKQIETAGGDETLKAKIYDKQKQEIAALILDSFKAEESIGKVAEQVQSLGKAARSALQNNLQKIVDFVAKKRNFGFIDKQDIADFAALNNVSEEFLNSLLADDAAFEKFVQYVRDLGKQTAEPIDNITKAIKNFKKAKEAAKSGGILDIDNLEYAQEILEGMTKQMADNILSTAGSIAAMFREIGEMTGNENLAKVGDVMGDIVGNIQAAEQGAEAWGGWWGAIIGGLIDLIPKIIKWVNMGYENSLAYIEKQMERTERMLGYWKQIYEYGSKWVAPDITQAAEQLIQYSKDLDKLERKIRNANWFPDFDVEAGWKQVGELKKKIQQLKDDLMKAAAPTREEAYNRTLQNYNDRIGQLQQKIDALAKHAKKNSEEIEEAFIELAQAIQDRADFIRQDLESTLGFTANSLASQIGDALASAFDAGTDAAKDFDKTVASVMRNVVQNIIMTRVIEEKLDEMFNEMALINWKGEDPDMAKANYIFQWLHDNLEPMIEGMQNQWKEASERFGWETSDTATHAQATGVAAASQDSIDELNGRMTVVQANTTELIENSALNVQYTSSILSVVTSIKSDTGAIRSDIHDMRYDLETVKNTLNQMQ